MEKLKHWTGRSVSAFVHRLSFDFITQIQKQMEKSHVSRKNFAAMLGVSAGRVSQVFNGPGNITLESAVEYAHGVGMKVALVAYDDHDSTNQTGPVNSEIFYRCWQNLGAPKDFFELAQVSTAQMSFNFIPYQRTSVNDEFDASFFVSHFEGVANTHPDRVTVQ